MYILKTEVWPQKLFIPLNIFPQDFLFQLFYLYFFLFLHPGVVKLEGGKGKGKGSTQSGWCGGKGSAAVYSALHCGHLEAREGPGSAAVPSRAPQSPAQERDRPARGIRRDFFQRQSNCICAAPSTAPANMTCFPFWFARSLCDIQTMAVRHSGSLSTCRDIFLPTQDLGELLYLLHIFLMFAADVFYHTIENYYYYFKARINFL